MRRTALTFLVLLTAAAGMGMTGTTCTPSLPVLPGATAATLVITAEPDGNGAVTFRTSIADIPQTRSINWAFGDGSTALNLSASTGVALTHSYLRPDRFTVQVFAFSGSGQRLGEGTLAVVVDVAGLGGFIDARSRVRLRTSRGDIVMQMARDKAPSTCKNFEQYVADGHYNNLVFHRVVPNFVIQGGAFESLGQGSDPRLRQIAHRNPIQSEAPSGLLNIRGTVSMALSGSDRDSASDQFFINLKTNSTLDTGNPPFTVFATVIEGMDVVDTIAGVPRSSFNVQQLSGPTPFDDVPVTDVVILSATRE